jgi:hypothetical protein
VKGFTQVFSHSECHGKLCQVIVLPAPEGFRIVALILLQQPNMLLQITAMMITQHDQSLKWQLENGCQLVRGPIYERACAVGPAGCRLARKTLYAYASRRWCCLQRILCNLKRYEAFQRNCFWPACNTEYVALIVVRKMTPEVSYGITDKHTDTMTKYLIPRACVPRVNYQGPGKNR